jgi:hypothetical protein
VEAFPAGARDTVTRVNDLRLDDTAVRLLTLRAKSALGDRTALRNPGPGVGP